ncbi:MAG: pentapeptide repeat-containing protein [Bacteroidota bacterium]
MKNKRNLLIGILLGVILGWIVGAFGFPMRGMEGSFGLGFIALGIFSLGLGLLYVWRQDLFFSPPDAAQHNSTRSHFLRLPRMLVVLILMGSLVGGIFLIRQEALFTQQKKLQKAHMQQQATLLEAARKSNQGVLVNNLLNKLDDELADQSARIPSKEAIARTVALGNSFEPYLYWNGDSLSAHKISPERGQLLLALTLMNIDSTSFDTIKARTTFSGAVLRGADMTAANLNLVDLRAADMKEIILVGAQLNQADLRKSNLWGSTLTDASFMMTDMKRAELSWADLSGAKMNGSDLNGITLTNAHVREADLSGTLIQWADLKGTVFSGTNISDSDLLGTDMSQADLRQVNFSNSNLTRVVLADADLRGANLTNAAVQHAQWLDRLTEWQVRGAAEIQQRYILVKDSLRPRQYHDARYRLIQNEKVISTQTTGG